MSPSKSAPASGADYWFALERDTGFEPATPALARRCSTTELVPQSGANYMGPQLGVKPDGSSLPTLPRVDRNHP